jgi:hypothetical protein
MTTLYTKIEIARPTKKYRFVKKLKPYNGYEVHCASGYDKAIQLAFFINNTLFSIITKGVRYDWEGVADTKTQQSLFDKRMSDYHRDYQGTQDEAKANLEKWINTPKESTPQ